MRNKIRKAFCFVSTTLYNKMSVRHRICGSRFFCLIQVYNQGLRNMDLMLIITTLCLPTIGCLGMALTVPYVFARSFIPLFGKFPTFGIRVCSH